MKILLVSSWYPWPTNNGAKLRLRNLLSALSSQHETTLIAGRASTPPSFAGDHEAAYCHKVIKLDWIPSLPSGLTRLTSFASASPEQVICTVSRAARQAIQRELDSGTYDLIIAFELFAAVQLPSQPGVPTLLEQLELGAYATYSVSSRITIRRLRSQLFYWKLSRAVSELLNRFAACTVVSEAERRMAAVVAPAYRQVHVIPNCIDVGDYRSTTATAQPNTLAFTGSLDFAANLEAASYFLKAIWPRVLARIPDARFAITGRSSAASLPPEFSQSGVTLLGEVDDVRATISDSWITIVPLLTGGGTRYKILESMALGTPVITTSKGCEGLDAVDGIHLLVADSPQRFAEHVIHICNSPALRARLAVGGRDLVAAKYDWRLVGRRFAELAEATARPRVRPLATR